MAGPTLSTEAFVLLRRPPAERFESLVLFSATAGAVRALHRVPRKPSATHTTLDLFDEVSLVLEAGAGNSWFIKDARVITRHQAIGRRYDTLRCASALAQLVTRNPVEEDSRPGVYQLLRTAFTAFETAARPEVVYFKSVYCFARDEGHPLKQQWLPTLPAADRSDVAVLLNRPVADQTLDRERVVYLQRRLDEYLQGHAELVIDLHEP